jgi:hypothetical protein
MHGAFRYEDGDAWREYKWEVSAAGTLTGTFTIHNPLAKDPFPQDFEVLETDTRTGDA